MWRLVHDRKIFKWTTTSTTCVFVESSSATFVWERNPCFRSSRVSSLLLPSRRVFLASLCSCIGKILFSMLRTHQQPAPGYGRHISTRPVSRFWCSRIMKRSRGEC
jgi:hypothetical protein